MAGAGPSSSSACSSGRVLLAGSGRLPRGTAVVTMAQAAPGEAAAAASTAAPSTTSSSSGSRKASSFVRKHLLNVPAYTPIEPFEVLSARYGRTPQEIVAFDARAALDRLGLPSALTRQRANGLNSMVGRIRDAASHPIL